MTRQQSCTSILQRSPPEWAEPSGYISSRFAIGTQMSFPSATAMTSRRRNASQLEPATSTRLNAPPSQHCSTSGPAPLQPSGEAHAFFLKEQTALLQMPRRYCGSCRSPLHGDDGHSECISCLGKSHADAALAGSDCSHCKNISLASLRSQIAFFSFLPFPSSQGPVRSDLVLFGGVTKS